MPHLGFIISVFLGLLELFGAAPDRANRQANIRSEDPRWKISNVSSDSLGSFKYPNEAIADRTDRFYSNCECIPYYECSSTDTATQDGVEQIDGTISPCNRSVEVCCRTSSQRTVRTPTRIQPPMQIPVRQGCGYRNPAGISMRITADNDNEAQFAEFPWMVAVLQNAVPPATQSQYVGGGSLINRRAILTAGHTVKQKRPSDLLIRAGEWDTQTLSEPIPHQEREVEAIIIHENHNADNLHWDFALLILKTPFDIAPNVNTICLPDESAVFDAARCTATGWGKDKFEQSGKYQAVLKRIELPVVPNTPCQTFLRLTRLGKYFILDPSFICAGGELGRDTCLGDGGSPLVCPFPNTPDRYVQSGIVAWGISCGDDRTPGVYASVAKARRWIDSKMAQYNLDISSYIA